MIRDWIVWGTKKSTWDKAEEVQLRADAINPFNRVRFVKTDNVVGRAALARSTRNSLFGATPLEVVRLDDSGRPKEQWLVVRKMITGYDLFNLGTGEYLSNVHPTQPILEVSELEVVVET